MLMPADKVGGWGQKGQKDADIILEWSLTAETGSVECPGFAALSTLLFSYQR